MFRILSARPLPVNGDQRAPTLEAAIMIWPVRASSRHWHRRAEERAALPRWCGTFIRIPLWFQLPLPAVAGPAPRLPSHGGWPKLGLLLPDIGAVLSHTPSGFSRSRRWSAPRGSRRFRASGHKFPVWFCLRYMLHDATVLRDGRCSRDSWLRVLRCMLNGGGCMDAAPFDGRSKHPL